jgi:hypothetical protein
MEIPLTKAVVGCNVVSVLCSVLRHEERTGVAHWLEIKLGELSVRVHEKDLKEFRDVIDRATKAIESNWQKIDGVDELPF